LVEPFFDADALAMVAVGTTARSSSRCRIRPTRRSARPKRLIGGPTARRWSQPGCNFPTSR
jgi:hypothetical protein